MRLSQSEEEIISSLAFCIVQDVRSYISEHQDEFEQWLTEQCVCSAQERKGVDNV